jgi:Protein of unknown function (DUF4240)
MDEKRFWDTIEASRSKALEKGNGLLSSDDQLEALTDLLMQLSATAILEYQRLFREYFWRSYRTDIWAVVHWRYSGCGDDSFIDVRSCLIALGKSLFFQVLNDPDSLTDLFDRPDVPFLKYEGFDLLAPRVYERKFGKWPDEAPGGLLHPAGEDFDFDDRVVMQRRFPRLIAKYPKMGK